MYIYVQDTLRRSKGKILVYVAKMADRRRRRRKDETEDEDSEQIVTKDEKTPTVRRSECVSVSNNKS